MTDVQSVAGPWTSRDLDILETLTLRIRFMNLNQIASIWWSSGHYQLIGVRRRLRKLCKAGLLSRYSIAAHPVLELSDPVCEWEPGMPAPNCASIAYRLQARWTEPSVSLHAFAASPLTANLFASYSGKLPPPLMWTHDLHMAEVYRQYRLKRPEEAVLWKGEDAFKKAEHGTKNPDAFLIATDGSVARVIDFGGRYDTERVLDFHVHCADRELEYELW